MSGFKLELWGQKKSIWMISKLVAILSVVALLITSCDGAEYGWNLIQLIMGLGSENVTVRPTSEPSNETVNGNAQVIDDQTVNFTFSGSFSGDRGILRLWLPRGAQVLNFSRPPDEEIEFDEPGEPNPCKMFVFKNIPSDEEINVDWLLPPWYPWENDPDLQLQRESWRVEGIDPTSRVKSVREWTYEINRPGSESSPVNIKVTPIPHEASPGDDLTRSPQKVDDGNSVEVWQVEQMSKNDFTMTTEKCQEIFDDLKSADVFMALRLPVETTSPTRTYTLPIAFRGDISPTITLVEYPWPFPAIITASLDYRFEYSDFLLDNFPADVDEAWVPLGIDTSASITCPAGINIPSGEWAFKTDLYLDLDKKPYLLQKYYCYRGQDRPESNTLAALRARAATWMLANANHNAFQAEGITCMGPEHVKLETNKPLEIYPMQTNHISQTQRITFTHMIDNWAYWTDEKAMTVTLTTSSTLNTQWEFYHSDSSSGPLTPVSDPFQIEFRHYLWAATTIPASMASGPYSLNLSVTLEALPTEPAQTSDLLWVGDWVAPPPPPTRPTWHLIYLPIVFRE